ncbi:Lar family restriction alleviation protein [Acetobacter fabarum]|uniref:Lar family restriction alleviation protein n=1 Tax=Acetobacter fabarum TaxID=483199 RepID=UPI0039E8BEBC
MSEELKSCPFCGSDDVRITNSLHPYVTCHNPSCEADGPVCNTTEQAITAWNTRAGEKV